MCAADTMIQSSVCCNFYCMRITLQALKCLCCYG